MEKKKPANKSKTPDASSRQAFLFLLLKRVHFPIHLCYFQTYNLNYGKRPMNEFFGIFKNDLLVSHIG
ncbi:hypothetical protein ABEO83_00370 [Bacillus glycinifermentans]|uniref:hypothetical protein n=1 Tax=Bacillus glycinifermentans TaxID=1664069 RepID=UPI003D219DA4